MNNGICDSFAYFLAGVGYKKVAFPRTQIEGEWLSEEDVKDETFSGS